MKREGLAAGLVALYLGACVSTPTLPEAATSWRAGRTARALDLARAEYGRWLEGNGLSDAVVEADLGVVLEALQSPVIWPDDGAPEVPRRVGEPERGAGDARGRLRADLSGRGVVRAVRAVRSVERLELRAFAIDLLALVWRREGMVADHGAVGGLDEARRSLLVKRAALSALRSLAETRPLSPR